MAVWVAWRCGLHGGVGCMAVWVAWRCGLHGGVGCMAVWVAWRKGDSQGSGVRGIGPRTHEKPWQPPSTAPSAGVAIMGNTSTCK